MPINSYFYIIAWFVYVCLPYCMADILWIPNQPSSNAVTVGSARYINSSIIQLVTNRDQVGAVWWPTPQTITNGFEMTVDFTVGPNNKPRTYFSFVIQGNDPSMLGASDKMGGFDFTNNVAVETGIFHVAVYGTKPPTGLNSNASVIDSNTDSEGDGDVIKGGQWTLKIKYDHSAKFFQAGVVIQDDYRINANLNIREYVNLIEGKKAYIGFTAASGSRANFVQINISNLNFTNNVEIGCNVNNCSRFAICTPVGNSFYCNCSQGTVGNGTVCEVQAPGKIDSLQFNAQGVDFLNISWRAPIAYTYPISGYHVQCYNASNQVLFTISTNNVTSYLITNLTAASFYGCRVRAQDSMNNTGEWSHNETSQTTRVDNPQKPSVNCYTNGTTLMANWTQVSKTSYDIANYTVYFQFPNGSELVFKGPENSTMTFSNLIPSATYNVFVCVFDVQGFRSVNGSAGTCIMPDAQGNPVTPPPTTAPSPPPTTPPTPPPTTPPTPPPTTPPTPPPTTPPTPPPTAPPTPPPTAPPTPPPTTPPTPPPTAPPTPPPTAPPTPPPTAPPTPPPTAPPTPPPTTPPTLPTLPTLPPTTPPTPPPTTPPPTTPPTLPPTTPPLLETFDIVRVYTENDRAAVDFQWNFVAGTNIIVKYIFSVTSLNTTTIILENNSTTATFSRFIPGAAHTFQITAEDTSGLRSSPGSQTITKQAPEVPACNVCHANATCFFSNDAYTCTCNRNFYGNGLNCGSCANSSNCPTGFDCDTTVFACKDINECLENETICNDGFYCENYDGFFACLDIDECAQNENICAEGFECHNEDGHFTCNDINECINNETICDYGFYCNNTFGSYSCDYQIVSLIPQIYNSAEIADGEIDILVGWVPSPICTDCCIYYVLEISVDLPEFFFLANTTSLNYTLEAKLLPRRYYFRVRCFTATGEASNYSTVVQIDSPGCPDSFCDSANGETIHTCPQDCFAKLAEPICSDCNNGLCKNGVCECEAPYGGHDCSLVVENTTMHLSFRNHSKPQIDISVNNVAFEIEVLEITEMDKTNEKTQNSFVLAEQTVEFDNDTHKYNFSYKLPNGATFIINAQVYLEGETIHFAQQNISIAPNSIKISLTIQHWNFESIHNSLQISMRSGSSNLSMCNDVAPHEYGPQWSSVDSGIYTFFGRYARNALIDKRAVQVTSILNASVAILQVPHFWQEAILDPDFSVLTKDVSGKQDPGSYCRTNKKNRIGLYVGVSFAAAFGVLSLVVGGHLVLTRQRKVEFEGMMKRGQARLSALQKGDQQL